MHPTPEDLRGVKVLADLNEDALAWLAGITELRSVPNGEVFVRAGTPAEHMHLMFEGQLDYEGDVGGQPVHWVVTTGEVAGLLPRSRMTHFPSTATAVGLVRVGLVHRDRFADIAARLPELDARLLAVMT
ncbi:cyclic nucleotide-binding domain-containing protein, partial [Deinococcus pimensis]